MRALVILLMLCAAPASACRLALAMALDVSGSVDATEYRLQMEGLADALIDPEVQSAIFAMPEVPVAVAVFEWSSSTYQHVIAGWTLLHAPDDLNQLALHKAVVKQNQT